MRRTLVAVVIALCGVCSAARLYAQGCDDHNACTTGDSCKNGRCAGTPVQCPQSADPCKVSFCNPGTGACQTIPVVCSNGNPCQIGTCVPNEGCKYTNKTDDTMCTDSNDCTTGDHCSAGQCVGSNVPDQTACGGSSGTDPCRAECESGVCNFNVNDGTTCLMGEGCTKRCSGGACTKDSCQEAAGPCATASCGANGCSPQEDKCVMAPIGACGELLGACDASTGACLVTPTNEGKSCDDGNVCTANDRCVQGACEGDPLGITHLAPAFSPNWQLTVTAALVILGIYRVRRRGAR